jgi:predicted nucleic acid-binding protein
VRLIVDSNILISALISPNGKIARLILTELSNFELFAPHFLLAEIISKTDKICALTGLSHSDVRELLQIFTRRIDLVDEGLIPSDMMQNWKKMEVESNENQICPNPKT